MAISWHVGVDYQDAGCVKIMKDAAYDPVNTPDSERYKFLYNSKYQTMRPAGRDTQPYLGAAEVFTPGGSNVNTFAKYHRSFVGNNGQLFYRSSFFTSLEYSVPLYEVKQKDQANTLYYAARVTRAFIGFNNRSAYWTTPAYMEVGWLSEFTSTSFATNFSMTQGLASLFDTSLFAQSCKEVVVWNLPGNSVAIANPPLAPVAGQVQVQITSDFCRASKPGYDARTATPSQLYFDSSARSAKVIAAADIALPSGTTVYPLGNLGAGAVGNLFADVIVYQGSTVYYPTNPLSSETEYGADYYFSGANLVLSNPYGAARARFIVYAQDDSSPVGGGNYVWREFNDGTRDVVQFLRPGASNPPRLADVMVDSRWPMVQLIAEGYINVTAQADGAREWAIPIDTTGLFPFVKYMTVHGGGGGVNLGGFTGNLSSRVRPPYTLFGYVDPTETGKQYYTGGGSTYCRLTAGEARFYTFRGLPARRYLSGGSSISNLVNEGDSTPIIGIRYYILGIPA
ncbi:hypothetical protein SAMN05216228_100210 [Rhizobium tibeticum]|uniref:Uncharacterized protein n=1 Tax=Rhizobium tibeticum TaxID=501024 RepID=A0A1H8DF07_9HYPH|nr:hypothetical protein [Rhizobium tibeticum]SEH51329.1 hypothetical protein RTCCBAU85039_0831 [Rhizobium tibeticum]SEN05097.1 hypothetical protein SAMN05216228_100210 [Rhizobium tibeticum]